MVARDRLGVKPLYHAEHNGVFYFASEVKALLPALPRPSIRHTAVPDFLSFLWVPDPRLSSKAFRSFQRATTGCTHGTASIYGQYWDISFAPEDGDERRWADRCGACVSDAVRRQMISDVPLGSFLSGGIDSSAIVAEASGAIPGKLTTYTLGWTKEELEHEIVPDDVQYAREIGRLFDVDYHERILNADVVELLPKLVWHLDEPVADPACITTYLICSAAKEKLTVILSGMGGDEVFAGYPRYLAAKIGRSLGVLPYSLRARTRRAIEANVTLGRPGRLRGPRRNLRKLAGGLDHDLIGRHLRYSSYYPPEHLARM